MENCFIKKLNGSVNDDNLYKYNEVRLKYTISQQMNLQFGTIGNGTEFDVSILSDDGYFVDGNTKTTTITSAETTAAVAAVSYPCDLILSYYDRKDVGIIGGTFYSDIKILGTMVNVKKLGIKGFVGNVPTVDLNDISDISADTLVLLELPYQKNIVNLTTLNKWKNLTNLTINGIQSPESVSLESILDAWYAAGRVSGSVTINAFNETPIKYNNAIINAAKTFDFSASGWTAR